jgi:hypothetical protein
MLPIPPLTFAGGSAGGGTVGGGNGWNQGTWTVNVAGSGTALQSASGGGLSPLAIAAAVAAVAYLVLRK